MLYGYSMSQTDFFSELSKMILYQGDLTRKAKRKAREAVKKEKMATAPLFVMVNTSLLQ
jgi:hypothetical protein